MNQEPSPDDLSPNASVNGDPPDIDSLLTAHALGQLTDGDRALVESRLCESADDRHTAHQTARLGKLLRQAAAELRLPERSPELREAVLAALENPPQAEPSLQLPERLPRRRFWLPLSLAASLLVNCAALFSLIKARHAEKVVAQRDVLAIRSGTSEAGSDGVEELADLTATVDGIGVSSLGRMGERGGTVADESADASVLEVKTTLAGALDSEQAGESSFSFQSESAGGGALRGRGMPGTGESEIELGESRGDRYSVFGGSGGSQQGRDEQSESRPGRKRFDERTPEQVDAPARPGYGAGGFFKDNASSNAAGGVQGIGSPSSGPVDEKNAGGKFGGGQRANGPQQPSSASQSGLIASQSGLMLPEVDFRNGNLATTSDATSSSSSSSQKNSNRSRALSGSGRDGLHGQGEGAANRSGLMPDGEQRDGGKTSGGRGGESEQAPQATAFYFRSQEAKGLASAESYPALVENPFLKPTEHPLSTFSIDVDTASYANVRRYLNSHGMPPADAVRVEELINYFQYDYPQPEGETPFSITTDAADCPWNAGHRLLRVGLKGREIPADERPASNLVFLLDVSGSMSANNKLPLVKEAMYLLTDRLTENDRVSIVVYAGNSGLVLPPTNGTDKATIRQAIGQLSAGGSTNGGQGLQMAYDTAQSNFIKGGTNRVILATDGDFNVGIVDQNELVRFIEERAKSGVFLSALGFGVGNLKDGTLEKLADKGNGNYAYIDTLAEARRVLVEQLSGTLVTIAKDVKIQIEFNPAQAAEYRLIGYEDRIMPHQDFHNDRKDAGEIGAGHTVTALYEIVPAQRAVGPGGEPLKYQRTEPLAPAADSGELATIKLRYKEPDGQQSRLLERAILDRRPQQATASRDMNFAAAVAAFGMMLRESPYRGDATYTKVLALAEQGISSDTSGYRSEFIELVRQAREISGKE